MTRWDASEKGCRERTGDQAREDVPRRDPTSSRRSIRTGSPEATEPPDADDGRRSRRLLTATSAEPDNPLDTEAEIAADYLEELLDIADLDGDIDTYIEGDRAHVSIVSQSEVLVGPGR